MHFEMATGESVDVNIVELIVAGWSGRNADDINEHIEELRALGVKPPSQTPLFYRMATSLLTTASRLQVLGNDTSGEAEILLLGTESGTCVGLASDHTDRNAEAWSVVHSKQLCPKPAAATLWRLDDVLDHWDSLRIEAHAVINGERVAYQSGTVDNLLAPAALLGKFGLDEVALQPGQAMLCGTLPAIGGVRPAERFEMALVDPVLDRHIEHTYDIHPLPIVN